MLQYISETLFLYKTFAAKRGIPQKNIFQVLPTRNVEEIRLGSLKTGGTWFWSFSAYSTDIVNLSLLCQLLKPRQVFEIGTLTGYTAFHFALNSPGDAKIYTLDLPVDEKITPQLKTTMVDGTHIESHLGRRQYAFAKTAVAEKITCLFGDSAAFDFSPFYNQIDLFFIDGAHSYEYVRSDTLNALRCCHPGSVIAWHDFGRVGVNGVSKWILEFARTHQVYCVPGSSLAFMIVKDEM
ncbi:MAG: hypothetical protein BroJett039_09410 [Chloroflexota bacterium]|nr:MAG: hypothetical protein BroJett039_09410 [Chloroflexota bacterium]